MRVCRVCSRTENEVEFVKEANICKPCKGDYQRSWVADNPEKMAAARQRSKDSGAEARSELRRSAKRLGLDPDAVEAHFETHHGRCDICDGPPVGKNRLAIDHDHDSGTFRGLLCSNCNQGLGRFKDKVHLLQAAIIYLERN